MLAQRTRVPRAFMGILAVIALSPMARSQEVEVFADVDSIIAWLEQEQFWGEDAHGEQLDVPRILTTGISARWQQAAERLPVAQKKEIFYRLLLPLVLHANDLVLDRRDALTRAKETLESRGRLADDDLALVRRAAILLRVTDLDTVASIAAGDREALTPIIDDALYRLDVIPAGLVLGQAAYESGYATSRFAIEGNALFGQWTYGEGLLPEQQREHLGDYRIASYEWPFDSVRDYYINLMSHPAYAEFRRLRAEFRANQEPLSSLVLADALTGYSERGQDYVDTLKSIIRVNRLDIADGARLRDEPMRFAVIASDATEAAELRADIERMRESGELSAIIERMRLE